VFAGVAIAGLLRVEMQGMQHCVADVDCLRARAGAVRRPRQKLSWCRCIHASRH